MVVGGIDVIRLLKKQAGEGRKTQSMDIRKVLHGRQQVRGSVKTTFHLRSMYSSVASSSLLNFHIGCLSTVRTVHVKNTWSTQRRTSN